MNPSESVNRIQEARAVNRPESLPGSNTVESGKEVAPATEALHGGPVGDPAALALSAASQLPPVSAVKAAQQTVADDNPLLASDDEVIEQEWVQKAKSIVAQTKGDPYTQEKEVGKLQADYLKKRYGKDIKITID